MHNQCNLWSMNNTTIGYNDNAVVKTIYDPCPAGFKMPASNAFTGFTTTGINTETESQFNINGGWDFGFHFNNKISSPDATVYFPASGVRSNENGSLNNVDRHGYYWSAVPLNTSYGCFLDFYQGFVHPQGGNFRSYGLSVRPVRD